MRNFHCLALTGFFVVLTAVLTLSYHGSISYADEVPGYMEGFIGNGVAIAVEDPKYGLKVLLPPLVPFGSHEWPFKIDASQAKGPATMEEIR